MIPIMNTGVENPPPGLYFLYGIGTGKAVKVEWSGIKNNSTADPGPRLDSNERIPRKSYLNTDSLHAGADLRPRAFISCWRASV
jgi:hypothetical protein